MEEQTEQSSTNVLARVHLTEIQVQKAIAEFLLKDDEIKKIITDQKVGLIVRWQTNKWSDPDALAHIFITETSEDVSDSDEFIAEEADDSDTVDSDTENSLTRRSPFFQED